MTHASNNRYKRLYSTKVNDGNVSPVKKHLENSEEKRQNEKGLFKKRRPKN